MIGLLRQAILICADLTGFHGFRIVAHAAQLSPPAYASHALSLRIHVIHIAVQSRVASKAWP